MRIASKINTFLETAALKFKLLVFYWILFVEIWEYRPSHMEGIGMPFMLHLEQIVVSTTFRLSVIVA
jgi:hypothetical protein